ncbi:hypothetical protein GCK32_015949, partial [Trichostrongylus colubriformis]
MYADINNVREELRKTKRQLKRLRAALPKLMSSTDLLQRIVSKSRDTMMYISIVDQLHHDVSVLSKSPDPAKDLLREAHILELRAENYELRYLHLRQCLRTLHAVAPILIATGKSSTEKWEAMLELKQSYVDIEGKKREMIIKQTTMERIIEDQLNSISNAKAAIHARRATLQSEEKDLQESSQAKITESIDSLKSAIEEMVRKIETPPAGHLKEETFEKKRRSQESMQDEEPMDFSDAEGHALPEARG